MFCLDLGWFYFRQIFSSFVGFFSAALGDFGLFHNTEEIPYCG